MISKFGFFKFSWLFNVIIRCNWEQKGIIHTSLQLSIWEASGIAMARLQNQNNLAGFPTDGMCGFKVIPSMPQNRQPKRVCPESAVRPSHLSWFLPYLLRPHSCGVKAAI